MAQERQRREEKEPKKCTDVSVPKSNPKWRRRCGPRNKKVNGNDGARKSSREAQEEKQFQNNNKTTRLFRNYFNLMRGATGAGNASTPKKKKNDCVEKTSGDAENTRTHGRHRRTYKMRNEKTHFFCWVSYLLVERSVCRVVLRGARCEWFIRFRKAGRNGRNVDANPLFTILLWIGCRMVHKSVNIWHVRRPFDRA